MMRSRATPADQRFPSLGNRESLFLEGPVRRRLRPNLTAGGASSRGVLIKQFSTSSSATAAACCHLDDSLNQLDQLPRRRGRRSRTDRMTALTKIQSARPTSPSSTQQGAVSGPTMGQTFSTGCPEDGTDFCFTVQKAQDT